MTTSIGREPVPEGLETAIPAAFPVPITLPAAPLSAAIARALLRSALQGHVGPEVLSDVELLTSELVANAAAASGGCCVLSVSVPEPAVVRIAVADPDPYPPALDPADLLAERGRGLSIVDALALRWGVEPSPLGKMVWFDLRSALP